MKKHMIVICERDTEYAKQFIQYLKAKELLELTPAVYSSVAKLKESGSCEDTLLLLIHEELCTKELCEKYEHVLILSEHRVEEENILFKYQSMEILGQKLKIYYESILEMTSEHESMVVKSVRSIGVIPSEQNNKSLVLAISLARIIGGKILLVNLQLLPPGCMVINKYTISEVIYAYQNAIINRKDTILQSITSLHGIDYIGPVRHYQDLQEMDMKKVREMLGDFINECGYETIIFVTDQLIYPGIEILDLCKDIFMPIPENTYGKETIESFRTLVCENMGERIMDKVSMIDVPILTIEESYSLEGEKEHSHQIFLDTLQQKGMKEYARIQPRTPIYRDKS